MSLSKIQWMGNEKLDIIIGIGSKSFLAGQVILGDEDAMAKLLSFVCACPVQQMHLAKT